MSRTMLRIITDIQYTLILFARNRQSVFFSFIFPILFLAAVGYLLGGQPDAGNVDYLFPGVICMCIMFTAINVTAGSIVKYRTTGVFRKIATTPLTGIELNASRMVSGMLVVLLSVAISLIMAWLVFGVAPGINAVSLLLIVTGSITFVGLGMVVAYLVDNVETVNVVAYVIIIPLILLSGSIFPVDRLPRYLQFFSILSPLTYLNNGLRDSMFGGSYGDAIVDMAICGFLCFMLFCIGVAILMGKEE